MTDIEQEGTRVLGEMLALFRDGDGWTQNAQARTKEGQSTSSQSENAHSFCLYGALMRSVPFSLKGYARSGRNAPDQLLREHVEERLRRVLGPVLNLELNPVGNLAEWNNSRENFGEIKVAIQAAMENGK